MAASVVKEISAKNSKVQGELLVVLREAERFIQRLPDDVKSEIEKNIPRFTSELNQLCQKLESNHCPILVAGETSAGKSSLLNLLLGEDVLPQKLLNSTHVICELKRDSRKHVVVHSRDGDCDTEFDLVGNEANQREQLSKYICNKENVSKYKKVEIFWPSPILHEGIFLVDSPGVGDGSQLDSITLDYLSQACAFIYVINAGNAGGVHPDGVLRIIREFVRENPGFHPKSAIFVFNKWDQVPELEEDEVKEQTIKRLQEEWPDLDPTSQVFYLSVQQSRKGPTEDFTKLLEGIRRLVPEGLVSKLKISYGFLENLLGRTYDKLQARLVATEEEVDKMKSQIQSVQQRLGNVQKSLTDSLQTLELGPEKCFDDIVRQLYDYLKSNNVKKELQSWDTSDIAKVSSFEDIQPTIIKHVERRISDVVSEWKENGDGDVQRAYEEIHTLKTIVEKDTTKVEEFIQTAVDDAPPAEQSRPEEDRPLPQTLNAEKTLSKPEALLGVLTAPVWAALTTAAAVIFLPIKGLSAAKTSIEQRGCINRFNAEPAVYFSDCAKEFLKKLTYDTVRGFLSEEPKALKMHMKFKSVLVSIKQENEKSLEDLSHEVRLNNAVIEESQPVVNECQALKSKLQLFHVHHLETRDIVPEDIMDWDRSMPIGTGSFAKIFKASLRIRRDNSVVTVALKVMRNPLSEINVSDVVTEGKVLRSLDHGNILKLIGCFLDTSPEGDSRYVLVTELCAGNLRGYVQNNSDKIPGKLERYSAEQGAAMKHITGIAIQLLEGLAYIHNKRYLHRDLKMENILVSEGDIVKLGDVGHSKMEDEVTGTQCGTLRYAAPEVYSGSRRKYTRKADIFSFGLMLWELWYGDVIFKGALPLRDFKKFIREVAAGMRPSFSTGAEPIYFWRYLMQQCWDGEPGKRPPAEQCLHNLQENDACPASTHFNIDKISTL